MRDADVGSAASTTDSRLVKHERERSESKILCIVWSEISKANENKCLLLFNQTFPCSETVYHSSALSVK